MDAGELELFRRSLGAAVEHDRGLPIDDALAELGWVEALALDARSAVPALFEQLGSANAASSALADVVAVGLGIEPGRGGDQVLVLPPLGAWSPPGVLDRGTLVVRGLAASTPVPSGEATVVAPAGDALGMIRVPVSELAFRPLAGVDGAVGLWQVSGGVAAPAVRDPGGWEHARWADAVRLAQIALGHQLVGSARTMLELARRHSLERIQFGRPISSFQAVRHRLAEALVAVETAEAALDAAWEDLSPEGAGMAKALAGRGARTVARHAQQILAGIGFTAEHPFQLYFKRCLVLDQLFGSAARLTAGLGGRLAAGGKPPRPLSL